MAILKIVEEGDDILRKKCREVTEITPKILTLLDDMRDTLIKANGVGLAAPQVGILRRIFIIDAGAGEDQHEIIEFINPRIIETKGHQEEVEGCLSVPGKYGVTSRPMTVTVEATDRNGKTFTYTGSALYGRCLCHENDHLDGILYIDSVLEMLDPDDVE
ncbi:MAG: peptide deformylase [Clostridia bacterium]|nr:peptide deformylase [Clostridia bacterium]